MERTHRPRWRCASLVVGAALLTSCGDGSTELTAPLDTIDTPSTVVTPPSPSVVVDTAPATTTPENVAAVTTEPTTTEPATVPSTDVAVSTTEPALPDGVVEQVIDGVIVRARSSIGVIPEQATRIEHGGTIIDDGDGPELCFGGVAESYPPQCDGPGVDVEMGDWATVEGDVAFGERTLVLAWPPSADGSLDVLEQRAFEPPAGWPYTPPERPTDCDGGVNDYVDIEALAAYASSHTDITATPMVVDGGLIGVLQVVESALDQVRADLVTDTAEPCLQPVRYSTDEVMAAQQAIGVPSLAEPSLYIGSTGSGNVFNRVTVDVLVADGVTVRRLAALVDDPGILLVFGIAEIIDGS